MTPTDRLSGFGTGLATNSDSGERVPRGHCSRYSTPNGSARASFFRSLATQKVWGGPIAAFGLRGQRAGPGLLACTGQPRSTALGNSSHVLRTPTNSGVWS